ncbi:hypothetical protein TrVFT333_010269 [Trichoderma virens FT-333]|nr:hypothetical protein TrVFT333_010269 [Trichoderma virens FT-333]
MTAAVPSSLGEDEIDALLRREFVEFHEVNEAAKRHRRLIDQLPEMPTHRPRNQNLLRAEKIIRLQFAVCRPPLIFSGNSFEPVLVLGHFCGDSLSGKSNNFRTLVQALFVQMFKQRPQLFGRKLASLTRECASDVSELWKQFIEGLQEAR